jgi:hypothetical protein
MGRASQGQARSRVARPNAASQRADATASSAAPGIATLSPTATVALQVVDEAVGSAVQADQDHRARDQDDRAI